MNNISGNLSSLVSALEKEKIEYETEVRMASLTTFKIGGPADIVITPSGEQQLKRALALCHSAQVPLMTIGNGSNLLVSDKGISGAVIHIARGMDEISLADDTTVVCGAGAPLSALCAFCLEHGLSGLEFAYGIPGSVGGAVYMNAGAYGGEIKDVIMSARYLSHDGTEGEYSGDTLALGYRKSVFTGSDKIIVSAVFSLKKDDKAAIKSRMDDYIGRRKEKQPLNFPSAGSAFKRPNGHFAGALIEQSGLKGFSVGGAQVSLKHAGFIINTGGATCEDVTALMEHIVETVRDRFCVTLEPEIIKIGR